MLALAWLGESVGWGAPAPPLGAIQRLLQSWHGAASKQPLCNPSLISMEDFLFSASAGKSFVLVLLLLLTKRAKKWW